MDEETAIVGILLAGALATVVGVLMWQGVWAGLAALAFPAALFAMTREQGDSRGSGVDDELRRHCIPGREGGRPDEQ